MSACVASDFDFLPNGTGQMAGHIRGLDWTRTAMGQPAAWPPVLKAALNTLLAARLPIFLVWGEEQTCFYNDAFIDIVARRHPEALGMSLSQIAPEASEAISALIGRAMAGQPARIESLPFPAHGARGGADPLRLNVSCSPVGAGDAFGGLLVICEPLRHPLHADNAAIAEIARLKGIFEQAPVPIAVLVGPEHRFEISNAANKRIFGDRAIIGEAFREAVPESAELGDLLDRVYRTGEPHVGHQMPFRTQAADGVPQQIYMNLIFQPLRDAAGKVFGIIVVGSDVTQEVQATAALRKSERRARAIIDAVPQMIWTASPDGATNFFNKQWYDFTGLPQDSLAGWEAVHPDDRAVNAVHWQRCVADGTPYEAKSRLRHRSGEYHWTLVRAVPVKDANGGIIEWIGSNTDIHGQETANETLKAENARKDEFLAMLAHELRNPLAPIFAAAEFLTTRAAQDPMLEQPSSIITRQVQHIAHLVDDLLDVSRVTRGHIELERVSLDLNHVIADAVDQVNHLFKQRRHRFVLDLGYDEVHVQGDHNRLVQVIANLLSNAAKYTPDRGRISLSMDADADRVTICVADNGIGMAPQLISHAFDLFYQGQRPLDRTEGGLGIGLSLVKSLIELHGGTVRADSEGTGRGSSFVLTLPRQRAEDVRREARVPMKSLAPIDLVQAAPAPSGLRILIVDDNADAALMMGVLLRDAGYQTVVEHDGLAALDRHRQGAFDIYLLDIGLPGMNGYELVKAVRASGTAENAVFIALSGYGKEKDRKASAEAGFHHHLVKPISVDKVQEFLASIKPHASMQA
ncbi:PAS domain S-box-containing protein [Noviherbaspirillum humi]|uniref:histidine kinase n=1 Tax=Noviherbaspirillum humi TaxID=1688639 RepID=A0A239I463_9BURK|nr:ATP-binding protein [Noviherbaspirillum humi]SNS88676.1 PAS domain S-box-containing protein [Noviherbaspirillum humi]